MKRFNLLITVLACLCSLGCSSEFADGYFSPSYFSIDAGGGEFYVTLSESDGGTWHVSSDCNWITVSSSRVEGNGQVKIVVSPNTGYDERTGHVNLDFNNQYGGAVYGRSCEVVQSGSNGNNPGGGGNNPGGGGNTGGGNESGGEDDEIVEVTVAEFKAAPDNQNILYCLCGTVNSINAAYGNFNIVDHTGSVAATSISNWSEYRSTVVEGGTVVVVGIRVQSDDGKFVTIYGGYIEYYEPPYSGGGNDGGNTGGGDNGGGNNGGGNDQGSVPNPPTNVTVQNYGNVNIPDVRISWNESYGATSYSVYRSTSANGSYSKIATTSNTVTSDSNVSAGNTYYYKVKASNSAGTSAYSNYAVFEFVDNRKPGPVTYGNCTVSGNNMTLRWSLPSSKDYGKATEAILRVYEPYSEIQDWVDLKVLSGTATSVTFAFGMYADSDGYVKAGIVLRNQYGTGGGSVKIYDTKGKKWIN